MESNIGYESLGEEKTPRFDSPVNIKVISYRWRNHDTDGVSIKAVLDGIVHAGILTDDSAKQVKKVTFESIKSKEEKTIIEIEEMK
jgi:Holliday junction resolvase RusA-like endonuclease